MPWLGVRRPRPPTWPKHWGGEVNPAALLLADPSPALRFLVLTELLNKPGDDPEVRHLASLRAKDPLVAGLTGRKARVTVHDLTVDLLRLGYLGFTADHPLVFDRLTSLFGLQRADGSWPQPRDTGAEEGGKVVSLQVALPLRALALCGLSTDERCERAYEWLLEQRLEDGAWPTGVTAGVYSRVAGYRRLPQSRWGCRTNTTAALLCLALHPERRRGEPARRGLDLLLGRETRERGDLGVEVARLVGAEEYRGYLTRFARFDLALLLDLCRRIGATRSDERVAELVTFVSGLRGPYGLWQHPIHPQVARWLTFDLLRSLSRVDEGSDWVGERPRTPFQPYPRRLRRY